MRSSRMNQIINMWNRKVPKDMAELKTPEESQFWDNLTKEAMEMEARTGKPVIFDNVEIDYDDPVLDIYSENAIKEHIEERRNKKEGKQLAGN